MNIKDNDIFNVLKLIKRFIKKKTGSLPNNLRINPFIVHYYNEIIRFWNKLNFIVKKTLRDFDSLDIEKMPHYLYATYRILWENASDITVIKELKVIRKSFLRRTRSFSWKRSLEGKDEREKFSICKSVPSFMVDRLLQVMNLEFLAENIDYMNSLVRNLKLSIRINNLIGNYTKKELFRKIGDSFKSDNIIFHKDPNVPNMLNIPLKLKNKVINNPWYKRGYLIFQDKASAAVIQALSPQQGDLICDMCSAPGIKTSLIAEDMKNKGYIIAGEFLAERMNIMKNLLNHLNVLNCFLINADSIDFPFRFENYFDRILLDAPCTGSGNFLASPELKWRQNKKFLHQNIILQKKLLNSAIKLLKPNGILVYSTCSLYPEEGEYQILDYLDYLKPLALPRWFSPSYRIDGSTVPGTGRLFPSLHQTQGFFIGKFKKKES